MGREGERADPPRLVPRGLRPFLRFTRLPDRALPVTRRVLDDDEEFRGTVRDATSEQLVGRPGWLFLDRPAGWEEELAELAAAAAGAAGEARGARAERETARRLAMAEESAARADAELAQRLAEVAELKEQLGGERRVRRRAESETGRLRQRVAELESDLEAGRRAAAAGREAAAEVGDLRRRLAELEAEHRRAEDSGRALEAQPSQPSQPAAGGDPRTGAPPATGPAVAEGAIDVTALAQAVSEAVAAVSTLADALGAAARQLAPFAPSAPAMGEDPSGPPSTTPPPRPTTSPAAPPAPQPVDLPPGVWDDSVEAADHLMRVGGVLVLVDGYNVTKLARPELALAEQRRWLADAAAELAARTGARLELVFDGADHGGRAPAAAARRAGVQVRYSPDGVEADDVVIDLVSELAGERPVVVASDDRRVQEGSRRRGANVITASQLLAVLRRPLARP